jgi:hypothetical protein
MPRPLKYSIICCFAIAVFLSACPSFAQIGYQSVQLASPVYFITDIGQSVSVVAGDVIHNDRQIVSILVEAEVDANTTPTISIDPSGNIIHVGSELPAHRQAVIFLVNVENVFLTDTTDGTPNMSFLAPGSVTLLNTADLSLSNTTDLNLSNTSEITLSNTTDLNFSNTYNVLYRNELSYPVPVTRNAAFFSTERTSHTDILPFCRFYARCHLLRITPKENGPMGRTTAGGLYLGVALSGGIKWQQQTAHSRSTTRCRWKMFQNI